MTTCLLVTSGTASIGSCVALQTPAPTNRMAKITMKKRCWIENRMMALIISVRVLQLALHCLGFHHEGAPSDHPLPGFEPGHNRGLTIHRLARLHDLGRELACVVSLDEDDPLAFIGLHGVPRHGQGSGLKI